jgi:hypothetical protein
VGSDLAGINVGQDDAAFSVPRDRSRQPVEFATGGKCIFTAQALMVR